MLLYKSSTIIHNSLTLREAVLKVAQSVKRWSQSEKAIYLQECPQKKVSIKTFNSGLLITLIRSVIISPYPVDL